MSDFSRYGLHSFGNPSVAADPEPVDPENGLASAIARLGEVDPEAAQGFNSRFGPDLSRAAALKAGINVPSKEDDGGILGKLKRGAGGALLTGLHLLDTPRRAVNDVLHGDLKSALQDLGNTTLAINSGGMAKDLLGKPDEHGHLLAPDTGGGYGGTISRFVEDTAIDPLTYVTFGAGGAAKSALRGVGQAGTEDLLKAGIQTGIKTGAKSAIEDGTGAALKSALMKQGVKGVLADETNDVTRESLMALLRGGAEKQGAKDAERIAGKQFKALETGAQGGIKVGLPFTEGRTVIPGHVFGDTGQRLLNATPLSDALGKAVGGTRLGLSKVFTPRANLLHNDAIGRDAADIVGQAQTAGRGQAAREGTDWVKSISTGLADTHVKPEELTGAVRRTLEGSTTELLTPEGRKAVDLLREQQEAITARGLAGGTLTKEQVRANYVPHVLTDFGRQAEQANPALKALLAKKGELSSTLSQGGHLNTRLAASIDEAERLATEAHGPAAKGKSYFEHNPAIATAQRAGDMEKAAGWQRTIDDLVGLKGAEGMQLVHEAPNMSEIPGSVAEDITKTRKQADSLQRQHDILEAKLHEPAIRELGTTKAGGMKSAPAGDTVILDPIERLAHFQKQSDIRKELEATTAKLDELKGTQTARSEAMAAGADAPEGMVAMKVNEAGRRVFVHKDLAPELDKVRDIVTNNETLNKLQKFGGDVNKYWKSLATVTPIRGTGFFARNALGNPALMFIAGVRNPALFKTAGRIQHAMRGGAEAIAKLPEHEQAWAHEFVDQGIHGSGFIASDLAHKTPGMAGEVGRRSVGRTAKDMGLHHVKGEGVGVQGGRALNETIENNARLATYIHFRKDGLAPRDAAIKVKDTLFDYADLTAAERKYAKPTMAFYTFMRKNLGAHGRALAHNPGSLSVQAHLYNAVAAGGQDVSGALPQYGVEQGGIPIGGKLGALLGGGGNPVLASPDLPIGAAMRAVSPMIGAARQAASYVPGLKGVRPAGGASAVGKDLLGLPSGAGAEVVRGLTEATTHKSLLTGSTLPPGSENDRLKDALFPLITSAKRTLDKNDKGKYANLLLGLNTVPVTPEAQAGESARRAKEVESALAILKAQGVEVPTMAELRKAGRAPALKSKRKNSLGR